MDNIISQELSSLLESLDQYDWFCDAEFDAFGKFVIYVHEYPLVFAGKLPSTIGGKQILIHYACAQPKVAQASVVIKSEAPVKLEVKEAEDITNEDMQYLTSQLDRLEKICGSNILQDIFYETHDGQNAVTNLSARFSDVRESLEKLYDAFGFDLIYEELDG